MIFLSASIPTQHGNNVDHDNADKISIREAVKALAIVMLPHFRLVWGGHPSITPLIRVIIEDMNLNVQQRVTMYQSEYFKNEFPKVNDQFENIIITPAGETREDSLRLLRRAMIKENSFKAGFFIGGMQGVKDEYDLFRKWHPGSNAFPIASTGGAAAELIDLVENMVVKKQMSSKAYLALYESLLPAIG
jgi:SLOG cluster3 family